MGVLGVFATVVMLSTISLTSAVSIVSEGPRSSPYIREYVIETNPSCSSSISRSYASCSRSAPYSAPTPRASSSFSTNRRYFESPGVERGPEAHGRQSANARAVASNFDTTSYNYDYRGPLYERRIISTDDFIHENKARSGFFTSNYRDLTTRSVRNEVVEKYVGATESTYADRKNNRVSAQERDQSGSYDYDGGFSFGKQRVFDESEYGSDSYTGAYYYRPITSPSGYYNWGY